MRWQVKLILALLVAMVAYELLAAVDPWGWPTISQMVWGGVAPWSTETRVMAFAAMAAGFVVLAGHFFFDWLR
jgi:hypothetical protein